jgi:HEAT repeat protein
MLKDPNAAIRKGAAFALRKLGSDASEAVPNLLLALEDEDRFVRINAACALYNIRPPEERVVAGVLPMLKEKSPVVRQTLLQVLPPR